MNSIVRNAGFATVACAALVLAGCSSSTSGEATSAGGPASSTGGASAAPTTESVDIFQISQGDCLVDDIIGDGGEIEGGQTVVDCSQPHVSEVYAGKTLTDAAYPGTEAVEKASEEFCASTFESFVGMSYADSALELSYLYPTSSSWQNGDKEILCLVFDPAGKTTGTLQGANR